MELQEVRPRLWRWALPHPEWTPEDLEDDGWEQIVASYAVITPHAFLLVDPLLPPPGSEDAERFWRALDRDFEHHGPPAILLTIFWHVRSSADIVERYPGASVWAHEPAVHRIAERTPVSRTRTFRVGETLPGGAVPYDAGRPSHEVLLWLPSHRALAAGDVLLGAPGGRARLCPPSWSQNKTPEQLAEWLSPLLELPVEVLLLMHGEAIVDDGRGALERALAQARTP